MKKHPQQHQQDLQAAFARLIQVLHSMKNQETIEGLLRDLLTPAELEAMVDRWRVAELLQQGLPYREINQLTGVSVTTIGRVARYMEAGEGGYKAGLQLLENP